MRAHAHQCSKSLQMSVIVYSIYAGCGGKNDVPIKINGVQSKLSLFPK